jgi:hypothetical protein
VNRAVFFEIISLVIFRENVDAFDGMKHRSGALETHRFRLLAAALLLY